ncbi:MAG: FHIPEP family type III secretion protein, partial [Acetivibrio sp.]
GLVSQIPSLMISLATGILVTKVSKEADLGDVLVRQLFSIPKVLYMVGGAMIALGVLTTLNTVLFSAYGLIFIITARMIAGKMEVEEIEKETNEEEGSAEEIRRPENVTSLLQVDPI